MASEKLPGPWQNSSSSAQLLSNRWKNDDQDRIKQLEGQVASLKKDLLRMQNELATSVYQLSIELTASFFRAQDIEQNARHQIQNLDKNLNDKYAILGFFTDIVSKYTVTESITGEKIIRISNLIELLTGFKLTKEVAIKIFGNHVRDEMLKRSETFRRRHSHGKKYCHIASDDDGESIKIVKYVPEDLEDLVIISRKWIESTAVPSMFVGGSAHVKSELNKWLIPDVANIIHDMTE